MNEKLQFLCLIIVFILNHPFQQISNSQDSFNFPHCGLQSDIQPPLKFLIILWLHILLLLLTSYLQSLSSSQSPTALRVQPD